MAELIPNIEFNHVTFEIKDKINIETKKYVLPVDGEQKTFTISEISNKNLKEPKPVWEVWTHIPNPDNEQELHDLVRNNVISAMQNPSPSLRNIIK